MYISFPPAAVTVAVNGRIEVRVALPLSHPSQLRTYHHIQHVQLFWQLPHGVRGLLEP
jgi:hypothetical protein